MSSTIWLYSLLAAIILFQIVSIPALILKKNDLADVLWGPAFPISALVGWYLAGHHQLSLKAQIILILIAIWAVRLFLHVGVRNLSHKEEDVRYNNWRKQWGHTQVWRSYLQVFLLQPLILFAFLSPVILALDSPNGEFDLFGYIGVAVWTFGFLFESISDHQLKKFKSIPQNKGRIMTEGLWSWSRHPNYFGEVVQWWGIWIMVLNLPYGWLTVVSPIGLTALIIKVSGVDMLEDLMKKRPGYEAYAKRTSKFIPRRPLQK